MLSRTLIAAFVATVAAQGMDGTEPMPTDVADSMPDMPTDSGMPMPMDTGIPTVELKFPAASIVTADSTVIATITSCPPGVLNCPASTQAPEPCTKEEKKAGVNTTTTMPTPPPVQSKFVIATRPCPCEATSEAPIWVNNGTAATSAPVVVAASARSTASLVAVLAAVFAACLM